MLAKDIWNFRPRITNHAETGSFGALQVRDVFTTFPKSESKLGRRRGRAHGGDSAADDPLVEGCWLRVEGKAARSAWRREIRMPIGKKLLLRAVRTQRCAGDGQFTGLQRDRNAVGNWLRRYPRIQSSRPGV